MACTQMENKHSTHHAIATLLAKENLSWGTKLACHWCWDALVTCVRKMAWMQRGVAQDWVQLLVWTGCRA